MRDRRTKPRRWCPYQRPTGAARRDGRGTAQGRGTGPENSPSNEPKKRRRSKRTTESPPEPGPEPQVGEEVLAEYIPMSGVTDDERWPALDPTARARLESLRDEPGAPLWTHATGDRLTASDVTQLDARQPAAPTTGTDEPAWVRELIIRAHAVVPRYRAAARSGLSSRNTPLADLPRSARAVSR
jgi:hypothetical protein